ncbi:MAG: hypothetical protein HY433_02730 [Candidatus Liptonbacteria bacterium]|nr:hypothetical protein [Candidatus Liptonbacteria bacterium]
MNTERTSLFLMANLGAEVSRIISLNEKNEDALAKDALSRANKIIMEIKTLPDMKTRLQEIDILAKVIENILEPGSALKISTKHIKSYFVPFSIRLMAG